MGHDEWPEPEVVQRMDQPRFTRLDLTKKSVPVPLKGPMPRPDLDYDVERGKWILEKEYVVRDGLCRIFIPAGFTLDLASVPRILWSLISSFELGFVGPLTHDFLYWKKGDMQAHGHPPRFYSREEADVLFCDLMKREGVNALKRQLAFRAVRWFGGAAWKGER